MEGVAGDSGVPGGASAGEGTEGPAGGGAAGAGGPGGGGLKADAGEAAIGGGLAAAGSSGEGGGAGAPSEAGGASGVLPCRELSSLGGEPEIDGALEAGLSLLDVTPVGWQGDDPVPDGVSMSYAAAWRSDGLYFFLRVEDPERNPAAPEDPVWMGDAVEIYVDADAVYPPADAWDDPGARQFVIGAPGDDSTPSTRGARFVANEEGVAWDSGAFVAVPTRSGFDVEAFVTAADLGLTEWNLSAGARVGFDLAHDVSLPVGESGIFGNRDSQYFLRLLEPPTGTSDDLPFFNENAFCTALLVP